MIFREVEDRDLVQKARRGDVEAYNLLVSRWEKRVYNYLLKLVRDAEDALDGNYNNDQYYIYCDCGSGSADTTSVEWAGWAGNVTSELHIVVPTDDSTRGNCRNSTGDWSTSHYRLDVDDDYCCDFTGVEPHISFEGVQFRRTSPSASGLFPRCGRPDPGCESAGATIRG